MIVACTEILYVAKIETSIAGTHYWQNRAGQVSTSQQGSCWYFYQLKPDSTRSRKPKGILPPKPYSFTERSVRPLYIRGIQDNADLVAHWGHYGVPEYGEGRLLPLPGIENQLVTKALLKLKDQRVNLGVAMAEAQDTANMIGDVASRIAKGYRRLAAKDPRGAAAALTGVRTSRPTRAEPSRYRRKDIGSSVPDRWLEYQYGINPLLSDLAGAWDELQRQEGWSWVTTVRANSTSTDEMSTRGFVWDQRFDFISRAKFDHKVVLSFRPQKYALQSIARLGMSNPLEIVWEKTPFSFVLDWMWPMGDCLGALDATVGYEFLHGSYTRFERYETHPRPLWSGFNSRLIDFSPGVAKTVNMVRKVYFSVPWPKPPSIRNPLSLGRMANGLSLLASVFGGRR